jgi:diadenylate cyclase
LLTYFGIAAKIVLSGFIAYRIYKFQRTQRSWEFALIFLIFSVLAVALTTNELDLTELEKWFPASLLLFLALVAFEPEIADLAQRLGQNLNVNSANRQKRIIHEIAAAARALAATKTGALIAFERNDSLLKFGDSGIEINADIKKELLGTLFTKDTPTHDGGVLVRKGKATHCGAVFPLTDRKQIENGLGTRHRAALGLTEKTDAVCLVVSEEEGTISLAKEGDLIYAVPPKDLEGQIKKLLLGSARTHHYPVHYIKRFSPKLVQSNFFQLSKSVSQMLYDLIGIFFWCSVLLLFHRLGILTPAVFENPRLIVMNAPWLYVPLVLLAFNLGTFLAGEILTVDGVTNQMIYQRKLLFIPWFWRKFPREKVAAVLLRQEGRKGKLWSLQLLSRKRKSFLLDQATSNRSLFDYAKKIRDILKIDLIS